ncbi:MAG: tetratricopeptide repeat protein [Pirellulaceae bacterium]|nr:tetratricopeptide repeat protein [Pirellulaceae bacterium]
MQSEQEFLATAAKHQESGELDQAERIYEQILRRSPDFADALDQWGLLLTKRQQFDRAIQLIEKAVSKEPSNFLFHYHLAWAYELDGMLELAVSSYQRSTQLHSSLADAHVGLGLTLQKLKRFDEAAAAFQNAIQLRPLDSELYNALGRVLAELGILDNALACFEHAIKLQPNYADAHYNLGNIFRLQDKLPDAIRAYENARRLNPDFVNAYNNLGNVLVMMKKYDEAAETFRQACQVRPDCAGLMTTLVHQRLHLCDWNGIEDLARNAIAIAEQKRFQEIDLLITPFEFLTLPVVTSAALQHQCNRQWSRRVSDEAGCPVGDSSRFSARPARSKIRLGYLSSDFHNHATAWLAVEMFEAHNRDEFEVIAYSFGQDDRSAIRGRLVDAFDRFHDIKACSHRQAAQRICDDEIDILVDLKGYTTGSRAEILALRPAPIQVNYLGFPGTMGADFIDAIIVDAFVAPTDQQPFFTERLVHLPGCYQVNDRHRKISPETPLRSDCGLPADGLVFCAFNSSYKVTPRMFDTWVRLLDAIPTSVLWQMESNPYVQGNLRREATERGISPDRLVFAPMVPHAQHLARHRLADLFLDTFPVNAHTTASDALWMGLPIITLAGETFVSRVAGSLLNALGLSECIASSFDEYESIALLYAQDPKKLEALRSRLTLQLEQASLFDGRVFAGNIEEAYRVIWNDYLAQRKS